MVQGKKTKIDGNELYRLRAKEKLKFRELVEIFGASRSVLHREYQKMKRKKDASDTLTSPASPCANPSLAHRTADGQFIRKRFTALPPDPLKKPKISNRELFDLYLTPEFIQWMRAEEPKAFLDAWTRLQPKDLSIGMTGNVSMELAPFDPRIKEITEIVSDGLSVHTMVKRIREILRIEDGRDVELLPAVIDREG